MQRMIPKQSKTQFMVKGLTIRDILFLTVCLALFVLLLISNFDYHYYVAVGWALLVCILFFLKIDDRLYYELYTIILFVFSRKKWNGRDLTAVSSVDGDIIKFKDGYYAGVLRIDSTEFFLLREEEQDRMIDAFSGVFKNLNIGQKISLIRLDRPVFLDERIEELKRSSAKRMRTSTKGDRAAAYIRAERLKNLEAVNTNENCFYYNAFYLVLYSYNRAAVDKTLLADVRDLRANNLQATRISGAELLGFARRTLRPAFDEREAAKIAGTKAQQEFVSPEAVTFTSKFAEVDGIAENTFVITRYPTQTFNAWARALCDMPYTKVVISATPIEAEKAVRAIDRTTAELKDKYARSSKMSSDTTTQLHYESLQYLMEELMSSNEVMLNVCTTVTAYDYASEGKEFRRSMRKAINRLGFRTSTMLCRQAEAFRAATLNTSFPKAPTYTQGINSSSLAAAYPFVDTQIIEPNGVMLGQNSAPVIVDFSKRSDFYKNSNIVILGGVGGGKSFFAKSLFVNLFSEGERIFILDPENEYSILADNLGGKVIDMGMGGNIINPFAVLTDVNDDDDTGNLLLAHITFLEEFFRMTLDGLGSENIELCLSLIPKVYKKKRITTRTDLKNFKGKFPTFDDFLAVVREEEENADLSERGAYRMIATFLSKFAKGGRFSYLWNGQTNLQANEDFVVFNFQTLLANANKTIVAAQMLLLTQFLNNELIHNFNRIKQGQAVAPITIAVDEAHVFIDPHNPVALRFMKNTAKRCRKYNGKQIVATQSVNDFLGNEDLERESKAVITECQYTFVFPLNASGAADFLQLYDKLDVTEEEQNALLDLARGHTFFIAHQKMRTEFEVVTAPALRRLFEERGVTDAIEEAESNEVAEQIEETNSTVDEPAAEPQESAQEKEVLPEDELKLGEEKMQDISDSEAKRLTGSADPDEYSIAEPVREDEITVMTEDVQDAAIDEDLTEVISAALSDDGIIEEHGRQVSCSRVPERMPEDVSKYETPAWAKSRHEKRHNKRRRDKRRIKK